MRRLSRLLSAFALISALWLPGAPALSGGALDALIRSSPVQSGIATPQPAVNVVVQGATAGATYTATFGGAPVSGHWLIAYGYESHGSGAGPPAVAAGWTSFNTVSCSTAGGPSDATLAYKQAGGGESATQTPFTLTGSPFYPNAYGMAMLEVNSPEATWAGLLQTSNFNCPVASGNVSTTNTATTSKPNTLGVGFSGWYGGVGTFPIVQDGSWATLAISSAGSGSGANSQIVGTQPFVSTSTAVTLTSHLSPDQPFYGMVSALVLLNP